MCEECIHPIEIRSSLWVFLVHQEVFHGHVWGSAG